MWEGFHKWFKLKHTEILKAFTGGENINKCFLHHNCYHMQILTFYLLNYVKQM